MTALLVVAGGPACKARAFGSQGNDRHSRRARLARSGVLGGLPGVTKLMPAHWRRQTTMRLEDINPSAKIAANEDLLHALHLAWVEAALEIDTAARAAMAQTISGSAKKRGKTGPSGPFFMSVHQRIHHRAGDAVKLGETAIGRRRHLSVTSLRRVPAHAAFARANDSMDRRRTSRRRGELAAPQPRAGHRRLCHVAVQVCGLACHAGHDDGGVVVGRRRGCDHEQAGRVGEDEAIRVDLLRLALDQDRRVLAERVRRGLCRDVLRRGDRGRAKKCSGEGGEELNAVVDHDEGISVSAVVGLAVPLLQHAASP